MGNFDVLTFNSYFFDLIITGLEDIPQLGMDLFGKSMSVQAGGTFNTVRALHRLGVRVGWVCDFGNDLFSRFVLDEIRKEGVDTSLFRLHAKPVRSFSLSFSFSHDRGFISYIDPPEPYDRSAYVLEHKPAALLLCSLEFGPQSMALVEAARCVGAKIYMDSQATEIALSEPGVKEMLAAVDVFMPNALEACRLTGAENPEEAFRILSGLAPTLVVKSGPEGAMAAACGRRYASPGLKVRAVDTTGAGDCFNAGFIHGHLQGMPIEACLRYGNICGGLSTTDYGTIAAPTLDELRQHLG